MAYIFGTPDRVAATKTLRIRFTCNGQTTPGQQATENSIADLRCERATDLELAASTSRRAGAPGGGGLRRQSPCSRPP